MRLPRSLTSRLVITAVALVAVVSASVGLATALAMSDHLHDELDREVLSSVDRAGGPRAGLPLPSRDRLLDRFEGDVPEIGNQRPGTLVAFPGRDVGFVLSEQRGEAELLDAEDLASLAAVPSDGEAHTVEVAGESYRVAADLEGRLVTGLPTGEVDRAVASLVQWEVVLGLLGVLTAAGLGTLLVRRQLRPLNEVAETAHAVAELPLSEGEIAITERVPDHLTDPRTETGKVGGALNTLLAHVETSLEARHRSEQQVRQFVADASHELRTPLTTIAGYTELARRRRDEATIDAALTKVGEESQRMTALVEDLLLLARLDAGRPLERQPVDLSRLVLETVDDAHVVAPGHHWRVRLPEGDEPVVVTGDELRLRQVVTNLLTNARKYTPAGSTVTVALHEGGFEVRDDGPGFPAELVSSAFERFSRGDASRHREGGVGLGLALVQAIVTAHGGAVSLLSVPGDTRIRVDLPVSD
ncbi:HAMP domain-containing histidine kinase [Nocardioides panacisoli]|uniref:sensor histidine kinase n=1 Tax=Nocardioides panacisoli TaxID=627624 RepID=UPI001C6375DF|nr:ATP-binding protein [Nocardioides panacisoli]QYJ03401.1 HAMP domain-containing histidine kinase [Nocardioides panacisoli]